MVKAFAHVHLEPKTLLNILVCNDLSKKRMQGVADFEDTLDFLAADVRASFVFCSKAEKASNLQLFVWG